MASSGSVALEICKNRLAHGQAMFSLIILDMQLPGNSGLETCTELRALLGQQLQRSARQRSEQDGDPFVCGVSAVYLRNMKQLALEAGMDEFLVKPLYSSELDRLIERALQGE